MLFSTPSHFLVLALLILGFWLIGFATHPGGRKWRKMYEQEADDFSSYRTDADDKVRAAARRVSDVEREIAEFERERAESASAIAELEAGLERERRDSATAIADLEARLQAARAPVAPVAPTPAFAPAVPEEQKKAWFGAASYNDLTEIRGIDAVLSTRLFGLGVTRFADLEKLSAVDEMALEQRLNVPVGFIAREQWREQAALLRAGNFAEHSHRFGAPIHV